MFCSLHTPKKHARLVEKLLAALPDIDTAITPDGHRLMKGYLLEGETSKVRLAHACVAYLEQPTEIMRMALAVSRGWFMFATPLLANAGTSRGLSISCFLNYVDDSREGLSAHYDENIWMSTIGGGIGSHWSAVRGKGEVTSNGSESTGIVPFIVVGDAQVRAFRQGGVRRGAYATYLNVSHPEILEYLSIRTPEGDQSRKAFFTHIGVNLTDDFMMAVTAGGSWDLIDPNSGRVTDTVNARFLWGEILTKRFTDRGEPFLFFSDVAKRHSPYRSHLREDINGSNLCTEITLATNSQRSAVCCISSLNAATSSEWLDGGKFVALFVKMLDNALTVFCKQAPVGLQKAVFTALEERSIGIGMMGLHTYLQGLGIPFDGSPADTHLFAQVKHQAEEASLKLGRERGAAPDSVHGRRNTHLLAIAPNASSSIMLGVSPGVEPYRSNLYTIIQGKLMFEVRSPELSSVIESLSPAYDPADLWQEVADAGGSVQGVDWLSEDYKKVFLCAHEIDQADIIDAARLRQTYICQAQSINLFYAPNTHPKKVSRDHFRAWEPEGVGVPLKSLYYCRIEVDTKVESTSTQAQREVAPATSCSIANKDECLSCQ